MEIRTWPTGSYLSSSCVSHRWRRSRRRSVGDSRGSIDRSCEKRACTVQSNTPKRECFFCTAYRRSCDSNHQGCASKISIHERTREQTIGKRRFLCLEPFVARWKSARDSPKRIFREKESSKKSIFAVLSWVEPTYRVRMVKLLSFLSERSSRERMRDLLAIEIKIEINEARFLKFALGDSFRTRNR